MGGKTFLTNVCPGLTGPKKDGEFKEDGSWKRMCKSLRGTEARGCAKNMHRIPALDSFKPGPFCPPARSPLSLSLSSDILASSDVIVSASYSVIQS